MDAEATLRYGYLSRKNKIFFAYCLNCIFATADGSGMTANLSRVR
jgi:hypothetical protein